MAAHAAALGTPCGDDLADVRVLSLTGKSRTLESVAAPRDQRPTLVLLWSAYDPVSRRAIRELDSLTAGRSVRVIALASLEYREPLESVAEVAKRSQVSIPVYVDGRGEAVRAIESCARGTSSMSSVFALTVGDDGWRMSRIVATWNDRSRSRLEEWLVGGEANEEQER
jgi:hypothetical protein